MKIDEVLDGCMKKSMYELQVLQSCRQKCLKLHKFGEQEVLSGILCFLLSFIKRGISHIWEGCVAFATRAFATPIFVASATPIFVASATPYFRTFATRTAATPNFFFNFSFV